MTAEELTKLQEKAALLEKQEQVQVARVREEHVRMQTVGWDATAVAQTGTGLNPKGVPWERWVVLDAQARWEAFLSKDALGKINPGDPVRVVSFVNNRNQREMRITLPRT